MHKIKELTIIVRDQIQLPDELNLETEVFPEGWKVVQSGNAYWLDQQIRAYGWHFVRPSQGLLRSGVGQTPEEALTHASKLALRRIEARFNAVEVRSFEMSNYPGFCIARLQVFPCQIQMNAVLSPSGEDSELPMAACARRRAITAAPVVGAAQSMEEDEMSGFQQMQHSDEESFVI
jgi:hypothetical protein